MIPPSLPYMQPKLKVRAGRDAKGAAELDRFPSLFARKK
jgi:hypothetical protein